MKKQCSDCKCFLDISSFYKHPKTKDGLLNRCKKCHLIACKKTRNQENSLKYEHKRAKTQKRKDLARKTSKQYRAEHPDRKDAQQKAERAIKKGLIKKQVVCSVCNKEKKLQMHHTDYTKPFDVIFVCSSCHNKIHHNTPL